MSKQGSTTHRLIVGLGNPGSEYEYTRHNLGFLVVQSYAEKLQAAFKQEKRFESLHARKTVAGHVVDLLLPLTYMNESGRSVVKFMQYFDIPLENLIVVVDDMALEFGTTRLRAAGSSGGHNGLKSIETTLATQQFVRLRLGIGSCLKSQHVHHVLGGFSKEEKKELPDFIEKGVNVLERLLCEDVLAVANEVNRKKSTVPDLTLPKVQDSERIINK